MPFGQIVIGPPGSGKTTYCNGMQQFLQLLGRKTTVVNLDPANDWLPYECGINIEELIRLEDVMAQFGLGPNGGLIYCMDYLEKNLDWLEDKLRPLAREHHYFLFDLPGQVELFTLHENVKNVVRRLIDASDYRLVAVHLVDAHLCSDAHKYVAATLLSLNAMLHLELPHVNVLSKIDLVESYGTLDFNLEYYTEVQDLSYLQGCLDKEETKGQRHSLKLKKLNAALCGVIEDFALVSFETLAIQDKESVAHLIQVLDKSIGYYFQGPPPTIGATAGGTGGEGGAAPALPILPSLDYTASRLGDIEEKYMRRR